MHNIPDDCVAHPMAPWNEQEWHCPECGGHQDDVDCAPGECAHDDEEKTS